MSKQKDQAISRLGRKKDRRRGISIAKASRVVGYGSLGMLGIIGLALLLPTVKDLSHATDEHEITNNVHTDVKSYVRSTIALAITGQVNLDLTPKSQGSFSAETAKLTVSTNNISGYSVYLAMVNSSSNSLLPMNTRSPEEIKATPETLTAENYQSYLNTWGYMVEGKDAGYQAVPTVTSTPIITESNKQEANYDLSFAVAVGTNLPAGVYGNQVLVSTVANPIEIRGINDLTHMQEMTSDICAVSFEGETKQLIDSRDGKSYWVAKLKDGNCWMTQNLALDLSTEVALTPEDSDIKNAWTPSYNTNTAESIDVSPNIDEYSWNFGKIVLATPGRAIGCQQTPESYNITPSYLREYCGNVGLYDVSDSTWKPTFVAKQGTLTLPNGQIYPTDTKNDDTPNIVAIDMEASTYDAHYLIGNYYQYNTATAGTGTALAEAGANADGSICPKGWELPHVENDNPYTTNKSYTNLLKLYNLMYPANWGCVTGGTANCSHLSSDISMIAPPIYITRAGAVNPQAADTPTAIGGAGMMAYYLTGTIQTNTGIINAFTINTDWSSEKADWTERNGGYSVRCVAK